MQFLADENVHARVVRSLREAGLDVEWIRDSSYGSSDIQILQRRDISSLVFITGDKDFGDLIFNKGFPAPYAIFFSRIPHRDHALTTDRILTEIENGLAEHHIYTFTEKATRRRKFPQE